MNTLIRRLAPALLLAAACSLPGNADAAGDSGLRLELLVNGQPITEYAHDGGTYVEALRGREYSLRVTNLEPVRVAVAISVDGRNVIDARRTSAGDARKWVLAPWQSMVLDGWQVSDLRAKRFFFTTEARSYAEWLGDSSNAGVVEAVAFRERQPSWWSSYRPRVSEAPQDADRDDSAERRASKGAVPAEAVGGVVGGVGGGTLGGVRAEASDAQAPATLSDPAATGIGRDVGHEVVTVEFEHESSPSATARLRYGFRDELVQLGVRPRPRPVTPWHRREVASGFAPEPCCPTR